MSTITEDLMHGVGCSEIAVALGLSHYETPYQLWERKTGKVPPKETTLAMRLGVPMEPVIKLLYEERTGTKLRRRNAALRHSSLPLIGHLDYTVTGQSRVVDCKSSFSFGARERFGDDGTDELPVEYLCQGQGYLNLTHYEAIDFAALIPGPDFRVLTVAPGADVQSMILEGVERFWRHVTTDTPPEPITLEDAKRRWRNVSPEKCVTATPEIESVTRRFISLGSQIKALEKEKVRLELAIKNALQDAEALLAADGSPLLSWKEQTSNRIDTTLLKAEQPETAQLFTVQSTTRVLRPAKLKEAA
ncbi:MAG: YqaJ viral recombinase family protein [Gammaproteobacteria bacterium]|nr:YqaJ viral recombinase family protein [Gammaproteobacteria bacterium]MCP5197691.1 YqaJ viral recombinase family protein [Gammaproteobacteria bacterium]